MMTNLAVGYLAEPAIAELVDGPLTAPGAPSRHPGGLGGCSRSTLGTALTMIFGELVPKNLAIARPMRARATQPSSARSPP